MFRRKAIIVSTVFFTLLSIYQTNQFQSLDKQLVTRLDELGGLQAFRMPKGDDLTQIPQDTQNVLTKQKIALGKLLFHETALGTKPLIPDSQLSRTYTCASCHHVSAGFQTGARQAIADGGAGFGRKGELRTKHSEYRIREMDVQMRKTPSVLNSAYQQLMFWDGQFGARGANIRTKQEWHEGTPMMVNHLGFEGVESQAIAGFETHRMGLDEDFFSKYSGYRQLFDAAFPRMTEEERYSDKAAALAIAAYERTLISNDAPFQRWLNGRKGAMSKKEKAGAILFFGKAGCANCHSGPALNSMTFHALGMGELKGNDTYQTRGFKNERLGRGGFTKLKEDMYKFKTPQLYNLADASFFGHGATFTSVRAVVEYKNRAVAQNPEIHEEQLSDFFKPLTLSEQEIDLIILFLTKSLYDENLERYIPDRVLSGKPFPVSDLESIQTSKLKGR